MKTCALFLLFLTLSACYCDDSILKMIEKEPEGKQIMDALFLQVQMKGATLQQGDIYKVLKFSRDRADKLETSIEKKKKKKKALCKSDLKDFAGKVLQNQKWEFTIGRHVDNNDRQTARLKTYIDRVSQELTDYTALQNIITAAWGKWKDFQTKALASLKKVLQGLRKARNSLKSLEEQGASMVQLQEGSQYFTVLNEVRVDFEGNSVNLEGFRPIITKLLELMANSEAVNKSLVRRKLRDILRKISRQLRERRNEIKAINERQNAIFSALIESYKENILRINKLVARLNKELTHLQKRGTELKDSNAQAKKITNVSKNIFITRKRQCLAHAERVARMMVGIQKTRNIVAQIGEILAERFGALKSFFVETDMSGTP